MSQKSNNRLLYDTCAFQQNTHQSTKPMSYDFFKGKFVNCGKCETANDLANDQDYANRVDIETELMNRVNINSRCNETKHFPECQNGVCSRKSANPATLCDRSIIWKKFPIPEKPRNTGLKSPEEYMKEVNNSTCGAK